MSTTQISAVGLRPEQVQQYRSENYCVYRDLLSRDEVARFLEEIDRASAGATLASHDSTRLEMEPNQPPHGTKVRRVYDPCTRYELFKNFAESAKLLDVIEQLVGPNILFISSKINVKPAEVGSVVEWHQDMAYGPLTNKSTVSALIYLDDADLQNGCLQVLPGDYPMLDHSRNGYFQGKITEPLDTSKALAVEGKAGTAAIFSGLCPHASAPNTSGRPRKTLIISYRAADAFAIYHSEATAKGEQALRLVRGQRTTVARFNMEYVHVPVYPRETKSLYELQDLSRTLETGTRNN
jgi:ectoine hydroxylase-related dioxygenase (phytanoyl-CoA dioxygenase family)